MSREFSQSTRQAAYELFTPNKSGQRSRPTSYRGCWHVVGRRFFFPYRHFRFVGAERGLQPEGLRPPRGVAASGFRPLCNIPTAASRRSLGRISVPVWPVALSGRLPVKALVGRYPTNKLIGREPILSRKTFHAPPCGSAWVFGISPGFPGLSQSQGQVAHVLLTRSPLEYPEGPFRSTCMC